MKLTKTCALALAAAVVTGWAGEAHAFCTAKWADVTIWCPTPAPHPGPKHLTPTSRSLPTVGTPGLYRNPANGQEVQVYLHQNGTGYQEFQWAVPTDFVKP